MTTITLATEDKLSEAVGRRLLSEVGLTVHQALRKHGFGYLRSSIPSFIQMAKRHPVVVLTDLDRTPCPQMLIQDWFEDRLCPPNLIFRIAIPEVEAWLLADHSGIRLLFNKSKKTAVNPPKQPDSVADAKEELLRLAEKHAPKDVREDLIVQKGAAASQGLHYNDRLCPWVCEVWNPSEARERSPSLARAMRRLKELAESLD